MRRTALTAAALLALAGTALAQVVGGNPVVPIGFCQFSPTSATTLASAPCAAGGRFAYICATTATVYFRDDTVPAAGTVGVPIAAASCLWYAGTLSNLSFISATGVVSIALYK